jgi:hypothetical protein
MALRSKGTKTIRETGAVLLLGLPKIYFCPSGSISLLAKDNAVKDQGRKRLLSASMLVIVAAAALGAGVMFAKNAASERQRTFQFTYQVHVPATAESKGDKRLWIPLPQIDEHQSIRKLSIESRVTHKVGREQEYGNSYAVFTPTQEQSTAGI